MEALLIIGAIIAIVVVLFNILKSRSGLSEEISHQLFELTREIRELRKQVDQLQRPAEIKEPFVPPTPKAPVLVVEPVPVKAPPPLVVQPIENKVVPPLMAEPTAAFTPVAEKTLPSEPLSPQLPLESLWRKWLNSNPDLEKFIGENLINKIGIAVLVLGIGFFVKYAIDKDWIHESGRVLVGMVCGGLLVAIAHRLRNNYRSFSSVLVGGALSVFYFTIAFAFHQYHLIQQLPAFLIMVLITSFAVVLSLLYDRMELAILATIGGFITPFLVSNGQDNYVSLFTYMAILNTGLLALSYFKKWLPLHIISFGFTVLIYGVWLYEAMSGSKGVPYQSALLFATLFYLQFVSIQVINNLRLRKKFSPFDFSMLLAINVFYYSAGMIILSPYNDGEWKGLFTISLGIINFLPAWYFFKQKADRNFVYLLIGLTLTFLSLAAPVQLKGNYITLFWSAEWVLLLWFYQQSGIKLAKIASPIIGKLAFISLLLDWINSYGTDTLHAPVILNKAFITGLLFCVSLLVYYFLLQKEKSEKFLWDFTLSFVKKALLASLLSILLVIGLLEIQYQFHYYFPDSSLADTYLQLWIFGYFALLLFILPKTGIKLPPLLRMVLPLLAFLLYLLWSGSSYDSFINMLEGKLSPLIFSGHWAAVIILFVLIGFSIQYYRKNPQLFPEFITPLTWMSTLALVTLLSIEIQHLYVAVNYQGIDSLSYSENLYSKAGLTIVWGLASFVFIWLGMKFRHKTLRIVALVLFGASLLKLFLYDIRNIPPGGKIAAFILLGVVLLTVSFMYQRLKKLLIDDSENKK